MGERRKTERERKWHDFLVNHEQKKSKQNKNKHHPKMKTNKFVRCAEIKKHMYRIRFQIIIYVRMKYVHIYLYLVHSVSMYFLLCFFHIYIYVYFLICCLFFSSPFHHTAFWMRIDFFSSTSFLFLVYMDYIKAKWLTNNNKSIYKSCINMCIFTKKKTARNRFYFRSLLMFIV